MQGESCTQSRGWGGVGAGVEQTQGRAGGMGGGPDAGGGPDMGGGPDVGGGLDTGGGGGGHVPLEPSDLGSIPRGLRGVSGWAWVQALVTPSGLSLRLRQSGFWDRGQEDICGHTLCGQQLGAGALTCVASRCPHPVLPTQDGGDTADTRGPEDGNLPDLSVSRLGCPWLARH